MQKNEKVRAAAKKSGVYFWEIAEALGVSEATVTRWLRRELSDEKQNEILCIIETIARNKEAEKNA